MKKNKLKQFICFTAAVISCSLFAGHVVQAEGQTVSDRTGSMESYAEPDTVQPEQDQAEPVEGNLENWTQPGSQADQTGSDVADITQDLIAIEPAEDPTNQSGSDAAEDPADQTGTQPAEDVTNQTETNSVEEPDPAETTEETEEPKLKKPVLKASSKPDGTIKLSWNRVKDAAEYVLLCSTKKDSGFHRIYTAKNGECVYKDQGRVPGKVYYYQLAVFSKGRASRADSKKVSGRSLEQVTLTEVSNISGSRNLVLHWNPVKGADGYAILRKNTGTGKYELTGTVNGAKTAYTDRQRDGGTIYSYKVYAKDANGGRGAYSLAMSQMAIDKDKKMIALTYDDGPSAYTPLVLDALARYGGHATFFVVGTSIAHYADSLRRAVDMGCEIGNHTYDHSNLKNLSSGQVQSVVNRTSQAVKDLTGADVRLLRPPYGSYHTATFASAGMPIILWSIDTLDWKTRSTSATIQCVQQKAYDGAIVLMHDLHQPTALAADSIMKYLKSAGYQLVTVSEMAAYRGGCNNHMAYSQFRK